MLVMILLFLCHTPLLKCPLKNLANRDAGIKGPVIMDYNRDAGNKGPAVNSLAALMDCIPGFNTALLKELLWKLLIPAIEEVPVPGHNMSEAVEMS